MSRRTVVTNPARPKTAPASAIAAKLYVSGSTVKTHVARSLMKLGARDRAQLVVLAFEAGLVRPGYDAGWLKP